MAEHHRPTFFPSGRFEAFRGGDDPAETSRVAHETAWALLSRARSDPDDGVLDRLVAFTDENGIDAIAELWSRSLARSLPGALWRIYLLRVLVRQDPAEASHLFGRGSDTLQTIDPVVAGATEPTGPTEITDLADGILRGVFDGDLAIALERAAAFCRIQAAGCSAVADESELVAPERSTELTRRALRFTELAGDLVAAASLWRSGSLD